MDGTNNEKKVFKTDDSAKDNSVRIVFEDISDEVLEDLRNGSHEAFQAVYNMYYRHIRAYTKTMTRSDVEAEDITQNVFIQLWEKRAELTSGTIMRRYLFTTGKNQVLHYFRKLKINERYFELANRVPEEDNTSEEQYIAEQQAMHLRLVVGRMPKLRRQVFELSEMDGLTHDQIAKKLKIKPHSVANHIYLARQELKEVHKTLSVLLLFFLSSH